jgi:hypothetical protein
LSQYAKPAGGSVPIHAGAAGVEQYRSADPLSDRLIEGAADGRREREEDGLAAFADDPGDAVAVSWPRSAMSRPVASKIRSPSKPSRQTSAKSNRLDDSRAAVSNASSCRWSGRESVTRAARVGGGRARPAS